MASACDLDGLRALVVEDDPDLAHALSALLESVGAKAVEAGTAEEALRVAGASRFDLALVDYILPGMDGAALVRRARASERPELRGLPVVGLSGRAGTEGEMMDAGASCYVQKPADADRILQAVRWVVQVYLPERAPD
jgi:CheY-like chemotaxis protein